MIPGTMNKNILAFTLGICFVILFDLALGLFGVAPLSESDSLVGFAGSASLFVPAEENPPDSTLFKRNPVKERYFNPQSFNVPKPPGRFRIVTFGGSTTYGRPYLDNTSFSHWLKLLLSRYGEQPQVETINTGGISYASYRVVRVMREMVNYQPDLFVVYSGHNEFLEARTFAEQKNERPWLRSLRGLLHRSHLYSVLKRAFENIGKQQAAESILPGDEVVAQLEQVGGQDLYQRDLAFRDNVIQQYRESIETMVKLARENQVPLILCTLPSNLSGVSPFKSQHREQLAEQDWARWRAFYDKGFHALNQNNWSLAVEAFSAAEQIDAEFAELHYYKAQALAQLGQDKASKQSYQRAKQEDIVPLRALDEFNQVLREVAQSADVVLADVDRFVNRVSPGGIPGNNLFVDHVHPTIEGQQLVAWVILEAAVDAGLVPLQQSDWLTAQVDAREYLRAQDEATSPRYRAMGLWGVGRLYYWAGKHPEAFVALEAAWQEVKDIPEIPRKLGLLEVERGNANAALEYFSAAESMEPDHPWSLLGMAQAYTLLGEAEEALAVLERLPPGREHEPGYQAARGQALLLLGHVDEALTALRQALLLAPKVPRSHLDLAEALVMAGQAGEAKEHFLNYLRLRKLPLDPVVVSDWLQKAEQKRNAP